MDFHSIIFTDQKLESEKLWNTLLEFYIKTCNDCSAFKILTLCIVNDLTTSSSVFFDCHKRYSCKLDIFGRRGIDCQKKYSFCKPEDDISQLLLHTTKVDSMSPSKV